MYPHSQANKQRQDTIQLIHCASDIDRPRPFLLILYCLVLFYFFAEVFFSRNIQRCMKLCFVTNVDVDGCAAKTYLNIHVIMVGWPLNPHQEHRHRLRFVVVCHRNDGRKSLIVCL